MQRAFAATATAAAGIAWAIAVALTLRGADALLAILCANLLAMVAYALCAFVVRSWWGTLVAVAAVPYFAFDCFIRVLGAGIATDGPRAISALAFYDGDGSAYPAVGCVLIAGMAFALRRRAPVAWIVGLVVSALAFAVAALGRDASSLEVVWYAALAIDLLRPPKREIT